MCGCRSVVQVPAAPEEDTESAGVGLRVAVSCQMWVLFENSSPDPRVSDLYKPKSDLGSQSAASMKCTHGCYSLVRDLSFRNEIKG